MVNDSSKSAFDEDQSCSSTPPTPRSRFNGRRAVPTTISEELSLPDHSHAFGSSASCRSSAYTSNWHPDFVAAICSSCLSCPIDDTSSRARNPSSRSPPHAVYSPACKQQSGSEFGSFCSKFVRSVPIDLATASHSIRSLPSGDRIRTTSAHASSDSTITEGIATDSLPDSIFASQHLHRGSIAARERSHPSPSLFSRPAISHNHSVLPRSVDDVRRRIRIVCVDPVPMSNFFVHCSGYDSSPAVICTLPCSPTSVRSFGTEGRKKDGQKIPTNDKIYEFILCPGSDIKDLQVKASPSAQTIVQNDPAIIQSNCPHPLTSSPSLPGNLPSFGSVVTPELSSKSAQLGFQLPSFQGSLPTYQSEGSFGTWSATPAPSMSNVSEVAAPVYQQGYYGQSQRLSQLQQHFPLIRPPPRLAMPPMQQTLQF